MWWLNNLVCLSISFHYYLQPHQWWHAVSVQGLSWVCISQICWDLLVIPLRFMVVFVMWGGEWENKVWVYRSVWFSVHVCWDHSVSVYVIVMWQVFWIDKYLYVCMYAFFMYVTAYCVHIHLFMPVFVCCEHGCALESLMITCMYLHGFPCILLSFYLHLLYICLYHHIHTCLSTYRCTHICILYGW